VTPRQAIAFVEKHGIVLESANGPVPSLAQTIAGGKIKGSWWLHPDGKAIFETTRAVRASKDILVCRLIAGKVTLVHKRIWPALVRCAEHVRPGQLSQLVEEHTKSGQHATHEISFPKWVSASVAAQADKLTEAEALGVLVSLVPGTFSAI
jgi:hypothetical protein